MIRAYGQWGAEITAFTMNLVCRLISVAMCYRDGSPKCKGDNENKTSLSEIPPFFKLLVYTFNVPSCIASPFYEFKDFEDWIELKGKYKEIPDPRREGITKFLTAIIFIILVTITGIYFDIEQLTNQKFVEMSWYEKIWNQYGVSQAIKYEYLIAWCFIDSGMILSGLGYNGSVKEGEVKHNSNMNVNAWEIGRFMYA